MISNDVAYTPGTYCRPVEKPTAPSAIAFHTSPRIFVSSDASGARSTLPRTALRTVLWPIRVAKLTDTPTSRTPASAAPTSSAELPQLPATIDVTPIRTKFSARGVSVMSSAWVCTSMNPGATTRPEASTVSRAVARSRAPTAPMRPSPTPTSARTAGRPDPSTTVPPRISRS